MVFSSIAFLLYFFPLFLLCYYLSPKQLKNAVVLLFSVFFYSWGAPKFVFLLLGSTFLDFYLVKWMHNTEDKKRKKLLLGVSIALNLGLLAFFKYANFFVDNVNTFLGQLGSSQISWTKIALPIGISFYTFQTLTYSIDVYRKVHKPLQRVWDYLLYIMMFPQLIAGPIVRFNTIADQIEGRQETSNDRLLGFYRFCIGLGKKVLIANVLGQAVASVLGEGLEGLHAIDWEQLSTPIAWWCILAYTLQIYFDFSGYSDMAIGIGRMIGFTFPENFDNPYVAKSISEFWRRWHITLGAWMREYLYIPLGGNRVKSKGRLYFNLWFVFLMSGLWHGASWSFVIWGAYHGLFLVLERLFLQKILDRLGSIISLIYTFFVVVLGWVVFRIEDIGVAVRFYKKLFAFDFRDIVLPYSTEFYFIFFVGLAFALSTLIKPIKKTQDLVFFGEYNNWQMIVMFMVCVILFILSVASITASSFNPFIYYRF